MVQFTTRPDLHVSSLEEDGGLDLLVRITSGGNGFQEFFGVALRGTTQRLSNEDEASRYLKPLFRKKANRPLPHYTFPVIILLFSMPNDHGYYAWQVEPIVKDTSRPRLRLCDSPSCSLFNRAALDKIVERVAGWHERLFALLAEA